MHHGKPGRDMLPRRIYTLSGWAGSGATKVLAQEEGGRLLGADECWGLASHSDSRQRLAINVHIIFPASLGGSTSAYEDLVRSICG